MSTTSTPLQDRNGALVPCDPRDYFASLERVAEPTDSCDGCGETPGIYVLDPRCKPICKACAKYHLGHDQAEEKMIRSIIGAAIVAALNAGAGEELVRRAFEDALHERIRVEGEWMP